MITDSMTKLFPDDPERFVLKTCVGTHGSAARQSRIRSRARLKRKMVLFLFIAMGWQVAGHTRGLNLDEQNQAEELARLVPWITEQQQKLTSHPLGIQTLFIERQEAKKIVHERIARVYQYDYTSQTSRLLIIDLDQQRVIRTLPLDSVHLPLNQMEIDFARTLLAADDKLMNQLRSEQSERAVQPFTSLSELDVKASIFEPHDTNHPCAVSRCALLSLFDASSTVFALEPIVFLDSLSIGLLQDQ